MFKKFTDIIRSLTDKVKQYEEIPEEKRKELEGVVEVAR